MDETFDDSDDRFVARRGSQGEDWHWEAAPREPEAGKSGGPNRPRRWRPSAAWGWIGPVARSIGARVGPFFRPGRAPEAPEKAPAPPVQPPARELEAPSAPSPAPVVSDATTAQPIEPERDRGAPIRWSRLVPRLHSDRPRIAIPWSRIAEQRPSLKGLRRARVPQDGGNLLLLLASAALMTAIVAGVIIAVDTLGSGDGEGGIVGGVTETPSPTAMASPSVSASLTPTEKPSPTASARPSATPTHSPSPTATPKPTPKPTVGEPATATPFATPNAPQGPVAAGLWSNVSGFWWFGGLTGQLAQYQEGQTVPLLVQWDGAAGQTYTVRITYDCSATGAQGAIDYLSGVQDWGQEILKANHGPGTGLPDGAVSVPDTPGFAPDDGDSGVLALYGGKFTVLPGAASPAGACPGQRTITLPVQALGGKVTLVASAHLGAASTYGHGHGAASATGSMSVTVSVDGVGAALVRIDPAAVSNTEH